MLGTFFKVIKRLFRDTYEKKNSYLIYIIMVILIIIFYFINRKTFSEMYTNFINEFKNKEETFVNNMSPKIIKNEKPKKVKFNNMNKQKIFSYKEPPQIISETNEIEGFGNSDNTWLINNKKKMDKENEFIPDMLFPQNSNELIELKNNIEIDKRELKDIFSDMSGDIVSDVTDDQLKLIQGKDYNNYNTNVKNPENLFNRYDQPHFNQENISGIKAFTGNSFGSLL
jgi:c-di-AMP phosphodiesterase-like protein